MALIEFVVFHPWKAAVSLVIGTILGLGAFYVYEVSTALGTVAVEDFDPGQARSAIASGPEDQGPPFTIEDLPDEPLYDLDAEMKRISAALGDSEFNSAAFGEPIADETFEAYLLVGSDASGSLADTIILALQPSDGSNPIMVSLPRDLFVWNLCKQTFTRLNSGLGGCPGVASGAELLAIMVEDYTGIPIDHLARVNFDGFARLVDVMGGISVCVDYPTRDAKSHLQLDTAGCRVVDGDTALAWVRSRHPEQLVGGDWVPAPGSDFTRQRNQQDVLFQLAARAAKFSSPAALTERLSAVASLVRLDSSWNLGDAVAAAWRYRGISKDSVERFSIEVGEYRTSFGAQVLLPSAPFAEELAEVYDLG
ncbi:MAG TPA: LCP family protein [Acidimicrobiia bacterium]|nr:LCP family protein [Acidimicrobiia bacterium]